MQSVNEELQSTNEEMETAKEELQSVNEELATINNELQTKVVDLTRLNNDMSNLLAGTNIATVFVDHQLHILRFTPTATEIINLSIGVVLFLNRDASQGDILKWADMAMYEAKDAGRNLILFYDVDTRNFE